MIFVGDVVEVVSEDCGIPKGIRCKVTIKLDPLVYEKPYYIQNLESDYCCWASESDIKRVGDGNA